MREWTPDQPIPPWEAMLDPDAQHLVPGDYDLHAVATDLASQTDPAPAAITVTYGDTTPPLAPTSLVARVDGADVTLVVGTRRRVRRRVPIGCTATDSGSQKA